MTRALLFLVAFAAGYVVAVIASVRVEEPTDSGWRDWAPGADFV